MAKAGSKSRRTRSAPSALPAFQPTKREYPTRPTKDAARSASSVTRFGPKTSPRKCRFRKKNGKSCSADAQIGRDLCVFHDPAKAADGHRARRAGGINRTHSTIRLPPQTPDIPLRTTSDVSRLLAESINRVRRGQLDVRAANTVGFLAGILLKALEQSRLEDGLNHLEAIMGCKKDTQTQVFHFIAEEKAHE